MNWKRIILVSTPLGVVSSLLTLIASRGDGSGQEAASAAILCVSCVVFISLGCLQQTQTWLHTLCVSVLSYAVGDVLSRVLVPALREPLGESLGGLVIFVAVAFTMTGAGVWLRKRVLSEASGRDGPVNRRLVHNQTVETTADPPSS